MIFSLLSTSLIGIPNDIMIALSVIFLFSMCKIYQLVLEFIIIRWIFPLK
jgi:hypothetical protein